MALCCAAFTVLLCSCGADRAVQREARQDADGSLKYSIVFIIHGDGDYLYHDTGGNRYTADEEVLEQAKGVAVNNPNAEVFIFHQKQRSHLLFIFPLHDGEFFYFRNGRMIADEAYWRDQQPLAPEAELYRQFRAINQNAMVSLLFYCGHEIPECGGEGYDESYPERPFTIHEFEHGVTGFTGGFARFDLMVLSTCFGGTPYSIGQLSSCARTIVASPDNLHLSYFDLHLVNRLDSNLPNGDINAFARRFAQRAFDRLTTDVQTAVSVAVYDVDRVQEFVRSVHSEYDVTLNALRVNDDSAAGPGHCDCADLPAYAQPAMGNGVEIFYRPARFGRPDRNQHHSGWECWDNRGAQDTVFRTANSALK
jgi:hypothetical protein